MSPKLLTGEDVNLTLRDLTLPLMRRKRVWMLTFLCVFAVAALIGLLRRKTYESHMSIRISREELVPAEATGANASIPPLTDEEVTSEAESLKSHEFLERVVLSNGLQNEPDSRFLRFLLPRQTETVRVAHAVLQLGRQIKIHTRSSAHLIDVTYRSTDPGSGLWGAEQPWQPLSGPACPFSQAGLFLDFSAAITGIRSGNEKTQSRGCANSSAPRVDRIRVAALLGN